MGFRASRIRAGKKVSDVVEAIGCSDAAVYQWETGMYKPRADNLKKLSELYNCTVDDLLRDDDEDKEE